MLQADWGQLKKEQNLNWANGPSVTFVQQSEESFQFQLDIFAPIGSTMSLIWAVCLQYEELYRFYKVRAIS